MADITEPYPDVPAPTPADEEIVDPTIPAGNRKVVDIRRHPFGLVILYIEVILAVGISFGFLLWLVPSLLSGEIADRVTQDLMLIGLVVTALAAIFLILATFIYRQNRWIITDDSVTQVSQRGLFRRVTSELSMANIEDVSAEQNGILAMIFGFGTLKVETAGERGDFVFIYSPKPNVFAKIILDARERFLENDPEKAQKANALLNMPR